MFLNINQQLARCERVIRQRVRPHIHRTIEPLSIEAFDIPGEPMPATVFFVHESKGDVPFQPFAVGSVWGTTWGTTWFRLRGKLPMGYPKSKPLELSIDLGWLDHSVG